MKKFRKIFLTGLAVILPIGATVYVIKWIFESIDSIFDKPIEEILNREVAGLGFLFTIVIILFIGLITNNVIGKKVAKYAEEFFRKIPLVKNIYSPVKDIITTVSDEKSESFQKVVMIDFPMEGCKSIGFLTNSNIDIKNSKMVCVFVPTTPNPTSGFMIFVKPEKVEYLDIPIDEGLKMVISMGAVFPQRIKETLKNATNLKKELEKKVLKNEE